MMISLSKILITSGLLLDILGVIIMYLNSPKISFDTALYNQENHEALNKKARKNHRNTKIGLFIIGFGFTLQLIAVFL